MHKFLLEPTYLQETVASYVLKHGVQEKSNVSQKIVLCDDVNDEMQRVKTSINDGKFTFKVKSKTVIFERITVTDTPLSFHSSGNERSGYHTVVNLYADTMEDAKAICNAAINEDEERLVEDKFKTFTWDASSEFWRRQCHVRGRSMESVVLKPSISAQLLSDISEFVSDETKDWYHRLGVPYRRGYLFHGPPGTGKTSIISAIATHFGRNVHRINLVAPRLSDDSLQQAISQLRSNAIVALEDVDCLFGPGRDKKEEFSVTFSGLLNAIDGLQESKGVIFIFTSNHPDRLDPALRRKGRIDVELHLQGCNRDQTKIMFKRFYPAATTEEVETFANVIHKHWNNVTPAALQEVFVRLRKCSPQQVIEHPMVLSPEEEFSMITSMWG